MKRSIGLSILLGLCLGISSQAIRGAPVPNCSSCDCAHSQAWRRTGINGYQVLTTQPVGDPTNYGIPVSDARWWIGGTQEVWSGICLQDHHAAADAVTYNKWTISNVNWDDNCNRLGGQGDGWVVVAVGTGGNRDSNGTGSKIYCGEQ